MFLYPLWSVQTLNGIFYFIYKFVTSYIVEVHCRNAYKLAGEEVWESDKINCCCD
jgi:hypothetical protein